MRTGSGGGLRITEEGSGGGSGFPLFERSCVDFDFRITEEGSGGGIGFSLFKRGRADFECCTTGESCVINRGLDLTALIRPPLSIPTALESGFR